jgi:hypothetical protein
LKREKKQQTLRRSREKIIKLRFGRIGRPAIRGRPLKSYADI